MNIFIFRIGSIGDSIAALPAIRKIFNYYNRKLFLITNKPKKDVFSAWNIYKETYYFDNVFEFDYSIKSIIKLMNFVKSQKNKKILYYFVDESSFKRNFRNFLFFKFIGFDEIYGWKECIGEYIKRDSNGKLIEVDPEYIRLEKIVDKYLELEKSMNYKYNFFKYNKEFINICEQRFNFLNEKFLVLGIGGKTKIQKWKIDNYIYILNKLDKKFKVIILGGNKESKEADIIKTNLNKEVINLCGRTTVLESLYILKNAICYFGNDTGTAHMAGVVGTKVFMISSARDNINRWYPYGENHIVIRKRIECEGCWLHKDNCEFNIKCLNEIDKDEILLKLQNVLDVS